MMYMSLKQFTTLETYTVFSNPKLNHVFYEHVRVWKPNNTKEEDITMILSVDGMTTKKLKKYQKCYKHHLSVGKKQ
ncbi:hypothetical protein RFI_01398 [Reticulomyxa filosa]|uniref:Uncharacterized protein n=1 Tax=Reticulomyxa filosa TaxID=46433 RepID=X6PC33_RETFI|nr:hypothetical protein RFI_01398 [Reticulomyxa filosa]|eukprot:ETO35663.1 hypothetical protein RFI_01398 [Reticulomyxa filosa]